MVRWDPKHNINTQLWLLSHKDVWPATQRSRLLVKRHFQPLLWYGRGFWAFLSAFQLIFSVDTWAYCGSSGSHTNWKHTLEVKWWSFLSLNLKIINIKSLLSFPQYITGNSEIDGWILKLFQNLWLLPSTWKTNTSIEKKNQPKIQWYYSRL